MTPDELVARRDLTLDEKLRMTFIEGFETMCRERYRRPPTEEELRRALERLPEWRATARLFDRP